MPRYGSYTRLLCAKDNEVLTKPPMWHFLEYHAENALYLLQDSSGDFTTVEMNEH